MRSSILLVASILGACGGDEEEAPPPQGPNEVEVFMTAYFDTFDTYDMPAIEALFAPDVQADISGLGELDGFAAVRDEWLVPFTSAFPDYQHTVDAMTVD